MADAPRVGRGTFQSRVLALDALVGVRIFLSRKSRRDRAEVIGLHGAPTPF